MITIKELDEQCRIWNKSVTVFNKPRLKATHLQGQRGLIIGFSKNV